MSLFGNVTSYREQPELDVDQGRLSEGMKLETWRMSSSYSGEVQWQDQHYKQRKENKLKAMYINLNYELNAQSMLLCTNLHARRCANFKSVTVLTSSSTPVISIEMKTKSTVTSLQVFLQPIFQTCPPQDVATTVAAITQQSDRNKPNKQVQIQVDEGEGGENAEVKGSGSWRVLSEISSCCQFEQEDYITGLIY